MTKVYLRADENEAGVMVESIDPAHYREAAQEELTVRFAVLGKDGEKPFVKAAGLLTGPEARALVKGLLRWMLERETLAGWERARIEDTIGIIRREGR